MGQVLDWFTENDVLFFSLLLALSIHFASTASSYAALLLSPLPPVLSLLLLALALASRFLLDPLTPVEAFPLRYASPIYNIPFSFKLYFTFYQPLFEISHCQFLSLSSSSSPSSLDPS